MTDDVMGLARAALRMRATNGGYHLHHRDCIHNLPPEQQVTARGKTVDWWTRVIGALPVQITPEQWQTDPPGQVREAARRCEGPA
jgi:hypothetical protein